jgi:hypothetical protein
MSKLDRETVRAALADYAKVHGNIAAQEILKTLGHSFSDLPESKFAAALAATKEPPTANARASAARPTAKLATIDALSDAYWDKRRAASKGNNDGR